jgi:glutamine synthetase adenylyltransferase
VNCYDNDPRKWPYRYESIYPPQVQPEWRDLKTKQQKTVEAQRQLNQLQKRMHTRRAAKEAAEQVESEARQQAENIVRTFGGRPNSTVRFSAMAPKRTGKTTTQTVPQKATAKKTAAQKRQHIRRRLAVMEPVRERGKDQTLSILVL